MTYLLSYYQLYNFGGLEMMDIFLWSTPVLFLIGGLFICHLASKSNKKTSKLKDKKN